jgi:hypothetical protein
MRTISKPVTLLTTRKPKHILRNLCASFCVCIDILDSCPARLPRILNDLRNWWPCHKALLKGIRVALFEDIAIVFSLLLINQLLSNHSVSLFIVSIIFLWISLVLFPAIKMLVSSAKNAKNVGLPCSMPASRLFMYSKINTGPRTEPRGTPWVVVILWDRQSMILFVSLHLNCM